MFILTLVTSDFKDYTFCGNYKDVWGLYWWLKQMIEQKLSSTGLGPIGRLTIRDGKGIAYNPLKGVVPIPFDSGDGIIVLQKRNFGGQT